MYAIYGFLLLLALIIGYSIYFVIRLKKTQPLTPSDQLASINFLIGSVIAVVALRIGAVSLKVSFDSYKVATEAYKDAQSGGQQQLDALKAARESIIQTGTDQKDTLGKSRTALELVLNSSQRQQAILDKSLKTSESQLSILTEQKRREQEQPDVSLLILRPQELEAMVFNRSATKIARNVHYSVNFVLVDRGRPDGTYPAYSTSTHETDYIRPLGGYFPSVLTFHNSDSLPLQRGERLLGWASVTCPDCAHDRVYWVYWKYQESGYYLERFDGKLPLGEMPLVQPREALERFLKEPGLTPIPESYK